MTARNAWVVRARPRPTAALRLFCFPYAGAGASAFASWADALPAGVELCAVQPPGRESRLLEAPIDRVDTLVEALRAELHPWLDRPFAFFGHSCGALVAFELARALRRTGGPAPLLLVASGRHAPQLKGPPPLHALPTPELIAALRRLGGTPEDVLDDPELMELLLPGLRADFALGDRYEHRPEPPLDLPIVALGGDRDPGVSPAAVDAWGVHSSRAFSARLFPGDHFFLHSRRDEVLEVTTTFLYEAHGR